MRLHLSAIAVSHFVSSTDQESDNAQVELRPNGAAPTSFEIHAIHPGPRVVFDDSQPVFSGSSPNPGVPSVTTKIATIRSGDRIVELFRISDFWRQNMDVVVDGTTYSQISYVATYAPLSPTDWRQVVVTYADSAIRTLPLPFEGQAQNKFNGSVVVGPTQRTALPGTGEMRPHADVAELRIDLGGDTFEMRYRNGGSALVHIQEVSRERTNLRVDIHYNTSQGFAFFTGMNPARDINSDHSQISWLDTNGNLSTEHVSQFNQAVGTEFVFWRDVQSTHNPSGPITTIVFDDAPLVVTQAFVIEAEALSAIGQTSRSNFSQQKAVQGFTPMTYALANESFVGVGFRYSRDDSLPATIEMRSDNVVRGQFTPKDTGAGLSPGLGWNEPTTSTVFGLFQQDAGLHTVSYAFSSGGNFGIEVDTYSALIFEPRTSPRVQLGGQWANAAGNVTSISQDGGSLTFVNAAGGATTGTFINATQVSAQASPNWGPALTGTFTRDGTLNWSNGAAWRKLDISRNYSTAVGNFAVQIIDIGSTTLLFENRLGDLSSGRWINSTQVIAVEFGNLIGTVANGTIQWANGSAWNKNLAIQGSPQGVGGTVSITATNSGLVLTNRLGQVATAKITGPNQIQSLGFGITGTRQNGRIVWSNGGVWQNFDYNDLNAVFSDIRNFPFG